MRTDFDVRKENRRFEEGGRTETGRYGDTGGPRDRKHSRSHELVLSTAVRSSGVVTEASGGVCSISELLLGSRVQLLLLRVRVFH